MKRLMVVAAVAGAVLAVGGCGGTSSTGGGGDVSSPAQTAKVTFTVKFPNAGVHSSRIDTNTTQINVAYDGATSGSVVITPTTGGVGTATIQLSPGMYRFTATAVDANNAPLQSAYTAGMLSSGDNLVVLSFISGEWTLDAPVTLSDGLVLQKFDVTEPISVDYSDLKVGMFSSTFFDSSKPVEQKTCDITWLTSNGSLTGDSLNLFTQFRGGTGAESNVNTLDGGAYNFTQHQPGWNSPFPGDRMMNLIGTSPNYTGGYNVNQTFNPDVTPYMNTTLVDGGHMSGTIVELTFANMTSVNTGTTCSFGTVAGVARKQALAEKVAGPRKAATSPTFPQLTVTYNECRVDFNTYTNYLYAVTETYTNVYTYPFTATGAQIPQTGAAVTIQ